MYRLKAFSQSKNFSCLLVFKGCLLKSSINFSISFWAETLQVQ
jgi:hypothetical protein